MVKAGDAVLGGKGLVVLEAMKMENEIKAPRDGVVKSVGCSEGAAVEAGQTLVVVE
jgi:pyruvate carboxylase subunit B